MPTSELGFLEVLCDVPGFVRPRPHLPDDALNILREIGHDDGMPGIADETVLPECLVYGQTGRQREFNPRDVKQEIAPGPFGLRGSLPPQAAQEIAARVLAARRGSSNGFVRQFVIQNRKEE